MPTTVIKPTKEQVRQVMANLRTLGLPPPPPATFGALLNWHVAPAGKPA
jgi:hypothetical protein